MKMASHPTLARDKVCYFGGPVAAVIGELPEARDAAGAVRVDYEVLPSVVDAAKAQRMARHRFARLRRETPGGRRKTMRRSRSHNGPRGRRVC